jgi:hypothetical protein
MSPKGFALKGKLSTTIIINDEIKMMNRLTLWVEKFLMLIYRLLDDKNKAEK